MSDNKRHIDDLFRRGLAGHETPPPHDIWEGINSHLSRNQRSLYARRILRVAAVILLLLGFGGGLLQIFRQDSITKNYLSPDPMVKSPEPESVPVPALPPLTEIAQESHDDATRSASTGRLLISALPEQGPISQDAAPGTEKDPVPGRIKAPEPKPLQLPDHKAVLHRARQRENYIAALTYDDQANITEKGKWTAGIMFTSSYSYRSLSAGEEGNLSRIHYNLIERGLLNLSGSFSFSYSISGRLSIQSGLDLLRMGQSIDGLQIFDNPSVVELLRSDDKEGIPGNTQPVSNSMGVIRSSGQTVIVTDNYDRLFNDFAAVSSAPLRVPKNHKSGSIDQDLNYFQVPVVLRYRIIDRKTGLVASGGFGLSYLAGNRVILRYQEETIEIGHTSRLRGFGMTGIMGIGIEHKFRNNILFTFEPRMIHFINPVNPDGYHMYRPYSLSVYGGVSYNF